MIKHSMIARLTRRQGGQALISILVFMAIGSLVLAPLLNYIGTALVVGQVFQNEAEDYYSADAGIIDAQWQIENDRLTTLFPTWNSLKYGAPSWGDSIAGETEQGWYTLSDSGNPTQVNSRGVSVQIKNRWVVHGITTPSAADAEDIITDNGSHLWVVGRDTGIIQPSSGAPQAREFEFVILYNPVVGENLSIVSFGAWLPPGFTYDASRGVTVNGSVYNDAIFTSVPEYGGTSLVWTLNAPTLFSAMPSVNTGHISA